MVYSNDMLLKNVRFLKDFSTCEVGFHLRHSLIFNSGNGEIIEDKEVLLPLYFRDGTLEKFLKNLCE